MKQYDEVKTWSWQQGRREVKREKRENENDEGKSDSWKPFPRADLLSVYLFSPCIPISRCLPCY